jgi:hypothetical protein
MKVNGKSNKRTSFMHKTSKLIALVLSLGIVSITTTGCLPKKVPVQKQRTISTISMVLNKKESSKETQDGITIKVKAIHPDNIDKYATLRAKASYWYYKTYNGKRVDYDRDGYADTVTKKLNFSLTGYPAFEVKITNSTDHVLKFSNSVLAVEDDKGNTYDALSKSDLPDYLSESINAHLGDIEKFHLEKGENKKLSAKMRKIRLVDNNLKVLPGKTVKAYAVFNYGNYTVDDSKTFIMDSTKFSFGLYELPSKVDKAGKATKTTNFNFVYDIKVKDRIENYTVYIWK